MSDSFLPRTYAGSELSGYETIKYMRSRGHKVIIFLKHKTVDTYDGFPIYKYDPTDEFCKFHIVNADIVFFQMGDEPEHYPPLQTRRKPTYIFIHVINNYIWLLQQKMAFPVTIVYNSTMTMEILPTIHPNMKMIPYVETEKFTALRTMTEGNTLVCLINCANNKGGQLLKDLAYKMPKVQFLGIKGAYGTQVIDSDAPNLRYIETQSDIRVVFKQIGLLLMPSKNETWGRTAVEAMASGVPVIHSEAAGLVECVGGAGVLCMRDDIHAWEDAIRRCVTDREYHRHLRQNGFKRIEYIKMEQTKEREELAQAIEG